MRVEGHVERARARKLFGDEHRGRLGSVEAAVGLGHVHGQEAHLARLVHLLDGELVGQRLEFLQYRRNLALDEALRRPAHHLQLVVERLGDEHVFGGVALKQKTPALFGTMPVVLRSAIAMMASFGFALSQYMPIPTGILDQVQNVSF